MYPDGTAGRNPIGGIPWSHRWYTVDPAMYIEYAKNTGRGMGPDRREKEPMRPRTQEQLDRLEAIRAELLEALAAGRAKAGTPWYADRETQLKKDWIWQRLFDTIR